VPVLDMKESLGSPQKARIDPSYSPVQLEFKIRSPVVAGACVNKRIGTVGAWDKGQQPNTRVSLNFALLCHDQENSN
jgi:hypothetical protein